MRANWWLKLGRGRCAAWKPRPPLEEPTLMLTVLEKVEVLQKVQLFRDVPTESLARIAAIAQEVSLETRKVLYKENAAPDAMFVVLEGEVSLVANGQELKKLGHHSVAGALTLLAGVPQPESAVAILPTVALESGPP